MIKRVQIFSTVVFLSSLLLGFAAHAQIDPTTSLLLRSGQQNQPGLDSSRYVSKPSTTRTSKTATVTPTTVPPTTATPTTVAPTNSGPVIAAPSVAAPQAMTTPTSTTTQPAANDTQIDDTAASSNAAAAQRFNSAGEGVQSNDARLNIANISVAPAFFYVNASSDYWYRRYFTGGPAVDARAEIWLNPDIGIKFGYLTSLGADIHADPATTRAVEADTQILNASLSFREFFSDSRKAPSLELGIGYDEYTLNVAKDEPNRIRLKKSGLDLSMLLKYPITVGRAWVLTSSIMPKLRDGETSTGISVSSGSDPSAYAVKIGIGEQFTLNRHKQVFWQLSHRYDKVIYEGDASVNDPISGTKPSGVSAATGTTLFELGFTWGS